MVTLWLLVTDQKKHPNASPLMGLFTPFVSKPWVTHFQWKKRPLSSQPLEKMKWVLLSSTEMQYLAWNKSHHRWPPPKERMYLRRRLMVEVAPQEEVVLCLGYTDTEYISFQSRLHNDNYGKVVLVRDLWHMHLNTSKCGRHAPTAS